MSVEARLSQLSIDLKKTAAPKTSSAKTLPTKPLATPESWEDELDGAHDDVPIEAPGPSLKKITSADLDGANPPPPTPVSPQDADSLSRKWEHDSNSNSTTRRPPSDRIPSDKRPEKTTATANRLIAGALGIKAPKKTEDQKQYEKATKEAEIKRKAREKELREKEILDDEKARSAVWSD